MKRGDMTDGIFLMHIVDALKETVEFTKDATLEQFLDTKLLIRGVTSSFEIAGEATKNLTQEFAPATIALIEALPEYKLAREEDARL